MTSPMAGLLTLDQAAEYLGMCRSTFASVVQPYIALLVLTPRKIFRGRSDARAQLGVEVPQL